MERANSTLEEMAGLNGMKVVILAGGMGSRISEESQYKPKPMIEIGDRPVLWHIMKLYSFYGYHEFIICCGYKGHMIKDYFIHYYMYQTDSTFHLQEERTEVRSSSAEPWKVTLVNTGLHTKTAGRLIRIQEYIGEDENFMLTYGDGVADVNIPSLLDFHWKQGCIATITTTQPSGRFGTLKIATDGRIEQFREKARKDQAWVNAGFMVLNREIFEYLDDGKDMLEDEPFEKLVHDGELSAYRHNGFWAPMDTIRDREYLEEMWMAGKAPWKVWE